MRTLTALLVLCANAMAGVNAMAADIKTLAASGFRPALAELVSEFERTVSARLMKTAARAGEVA